ncbi:darcynin family protein [Paenibacillus sp. SEL1]|uniref:darcynin family protein n=1 Tax=Paenibacillus TaxID=44249 RepID=UPI00084623A3|nr:MULTISPECIES: darcynin family protein [Paenibacillus]AOK92267.1 Darcynin 2 [Paenibacillus polymyxa]MCF2718517.1 Darcynin 2 [Paenibacillus sp. UKAQ_18]MCP3805936.1 Darcynin 2 [Paenibacillus sp. Lou8.1]
MRYMMIVLLEFYPSWLALPREERRKYAGALQATIQKYSEHVQVRFFDAEALPGKDYTDFVVCETEDMKQYHYMWEEIRDSEPYTKGYMKIKDVVMGMENAFQSYESEMLQMEK